MLDGAVGDSERCWSSSEEVVLVKRLILCDDLYVNINQGHLLNLSDQLRGKFSLFRPFEGGYEPPWEFLRLFIYLLSHVNFREST